MDLPEVRQCTDPDSPLFGTVAVVSQLPQYAWAFISPSIGGGWEARADHFDSWTVLVPKSV